MKLLAFSVFWILFLLLPQVTLAQEDWQYKPGVIGVSGSQTNTLRDDSGQLLSVNGFRRVSRAKLEDVSVYHALVFYPRTPMIGSGGGTTTGAISTERMVWILQKNPPDDYQTREEKELKITYDALARTLSVGSRFFSLSKGNLFIIRLDENWLPTASQIQANFEKRAEPQKVLNKFKAVSKDPSIKRLRLP